MQLKLTWISSERYVQLNCASYLLCHNEISIMTSVDIVYHLKQAPLVADSVLTICSVSVRDRTCILLIPPSLHSLFLFLSHICHHFLPHHFRVFTGGESDRPLCDKVGPRGREMHQCFVGFDTNKGK